LTFCSLQVRYFHRNSPPSWSSPPYPHLPFHVATLLLISPSIRRQANKGRNNKHREKKGGEKGRERKETEDKRRRTRRTKEEKKPLKTRKKKGRKERKGTGKQGKANLGGILKAQGD